MVSDVKTWKEAVAPIVQRCVVGSSFNLPVKFEPDGAGALGKLLQKMAELLDSAVEDAERHEK